MFREDWRSLTLLYGHIYILLSAYLGKPVKTGRITQGKSVKVRQIILGKSGDSPMKCHFKKAFLSRKCTEKG